MDRRSFILKRPPWQARWMALSCSSIPDIPRSDPYQAIMEKFQKTGATIIGIVMRDLPKYQVNQSAFIDKLLTYDRQARLTP